ncbi:hypothetical protein EC973_007984 [Apophysomyces ossiformis]|uniref:DSC E3 ubiquitin ligase complex subunit 3 ubiquitin-like domain-containing protein n=1 Tax=Apophysomyces ossiformis TaxID=679940 RepID=A0A8H7BP46_9FUNG|nr:hypothetical protein EC973_007984 [Apophysomyces ossiformis]
MGCCASRPSSTNDDMTMTPASVPITSDQNHAASHDVKPATSPSLAPAPKSCNVVDPVGSSIKGGDDEKLRNETMRAGSPKVETWPIQVRLSNAQDVRLTIPASAPFMSIAGLRQSLQPHIDNASSTRIKFIYLGRILPDALLIVPATADTTKNCIRIQKDSVIQAMVSKVQ